MTSTELLYIPYRNQTPAQPSAESRQKHAAREYHRKRRLSKVQVPRRAANPSNINAKRSNASAERALQHSTIAQDTFITPTASPTEVALSPNHPDILGKWRLDPFNTLQGERLPEFVQEMLDHGKISQTSTLSFKFCKACKTSARRPFR